MKHSPADRSSFLNDDHLASSSGAASYWSSRSYLLCISSSLSTDTWCSRPSVHLFIWSGSFPLGTDAGTRSGPSSSVVITRFQLDLLHQPIPATSPSMPLPLLPPFPFSTPPPAWISTICSLSLICSTLRLGYSIAHPTIPIYALHRLAKNSHLIISFFSSFPVHQRMPLSRTLHPLQPNMRVRKGKKTTAPTYPNSKYQASHKRTLSDQLG